MVLCYYTSFHAFYLMEISMAEKIGRPTKYRTEYCKAIIDYFNIPATYKAKKTYITESGREFIEEIERPNSLPTMEGFACTIRVNVDTLHQWRKDYPEFSEAYTHAKALQKDILIQNGIRGLYNPQFAIFVAKNCTDMREQKKQRHKMSP